MSQGEFKLNVAAVAAGMTYSSLRESRSRLCGESRRGHHCKARLDRPNDGSRSAGEGALRVTVFPFHDTTRTLKWNTFSLFTLSRYFI